VLLERKVTVDYLLRKFSLVASVTKDDAGALRALVLLRSPGGTTQLAASPAVPAAAAGEDPEPALRAVVSNLLGCLQPFASWSTYDRPIWQALYPCEEEEEEDEPDFAHAVVATVKLGGGETDVRTMGAFYDMELAVSEADRLSDAFPKAVEDGLLSIDVQEMAILDASLRRDQVDEYVALLKDVLATTAVDYDGEDEEDEEDEEDDEDEDEDDDDEEEEVKPKNKKSKK
jgi:hypothetical protein